MTTKFEVGKMAIVTTKNDHQFSEGEIVEVLAIHENSLEIRDSLSRTYDMYKSDLFPLEDDSIYLTAEMLIKELLLNSYVSDWNNYFELIVDYDNRTVTKNNYKAPHHNITAKCHPDDVFSPSVGKLICLLRENKNKYRHDLKVINEELDQFEQQRRNDRIGKEGKKIHIDDLWGKDLKFVKELDQLASDLFNSKIKEDIDTSFNQDKAEDKVYDTTHELKPKKTFEIKHEDLMAVESASVSDYHIPLDSNWYSEEDVVEETYEGKFESKGRKLGELVDTKQAAYGDSISQTYELMQVFLKRYENEDNTYTIPKSLLKHILLQVRIIDKQNRIFSNPNGDLMDESPYGDMAGYGLLGQNMDEGEDK